MKTLTLSQISDEQLIRDYIGGDNNAVGILYNRYYKKVYHKCLSFTKDQEDAFDFTQDVLLKAFGKINTFKGDAKFSTWLFSITHNHCVTQMTSKKRLLFDDNYTQYEIEDEEYDLEERELRENLELEIDNYLNELSEADKSLLDFKYRQKLSISDLQKQLNLSASAVKMRLLRARKKIEQIYQNHQLSVSLA